VNKATPLKKQSSKHAQTSRSSQTFSEQCYELLKKVPAGKVTTYKDIAHALHSKAYRAVGTAMRKNPHSFCEGGDVPCHRVVNSDGTLGGFAFGTAKKKDLLQQEGVEVRNGKIDLTRFRVRL
jgi:methylated-DNA-[protein]-cysteine S-methyltransferase